jgi:hypothetical protein
MNMTAAKYRSDWMNVFGVVVAEALLGLLFLLMIASMQLKIVYEKNGGIYKEGAVVSAENRREWARGKRWAAKAKDPLFAENKYREAVR